MKLRHGIIFAIASLMMVSNSYAATSNNTPTTNATATKTTSTASVSIFNVAQTQAIQKIIHDYLVNNPQVLVEAATALQQQQQQQWQGTAKKTVPEIAQQLFANPESPVAGNPKSDVTMVEFFDYQCPHCKDMGPEISGLLTTEKNLRVVYKAFPIFGDNSEFAAKAALAAEKQGKFSALHDALLNDKSDRLTSDIVLKLAAQVGLNVKQLQADMNDPAIAQEIKDNYALAKKLQLTGTPGFVFAKVNVNTATHTITNLKNPVLIPGAVDQGTLAEAVAQSRGS
jgi:protein-disulfide isomerase